MEYITGWATVLGLMAASALYLMNTVSPMQGDGRVRVHCAMGVFTLVGTVAHLLSMPFDGYDDFAIWSSVGLIFIIVGTGIILNYIPDAGGIRYHARSIHPALIFGIIIAVSHHVLVVLNII
jgi:predicted exporter